MAEHRRIQVAAAIGLVSLLCASFVLPVRAQSEASSEASTESSGTVLEGGWPGGYGWYGFGYPPVVTPYGAYFDDWNVDDGYMSGQNYDNGAGAHQVRAHSYARRFPVRHHHVSHRVIRPVTLFNQHGRAVGVVQ